MPRFRGVDAKDIAQSIQDALALLRAHSTGPELDAFCDHAEAAIRPGNIAAQPDDKALARYMRKHAHSPFVMVADLLLHHARFDTDGKGLDVYQRLGAWGGLSGGRLTAHTKLDDEQDRYLLTRYVETALAQFGGKTPSAEEMVVLDPAQGRDDEDEIYATLEKVIAHVANGDEARSRAEIGNLNLNQRHRVRMFMEMAFHAEMGNMMPDSNSPFDLYGIVIAEDDMQGFSLSPEKEKLVEKFYKVAEPLMRAGDLQERVMIGIIADFGRDDPRSRSGISFIATRKGAEDVARAFPDETIVNSKAITVKPPEQARKRPARRKRPGPHPA